MNDAVKRIKNAAPQTFEVLYLGCLFLMTFEIAVPLPISLFKGLYIAVFVVLALRVTLLREGLSLLLPTTLRKARILLPLFLLLGYIIWDAVGLLYSPDVEYSARKYYVVLPMLLFIIPTLCYAIDEAHLNRLYLTLVWSGAAVLLFSLSNYFVFEFIPLPYIRRLSTIADYNRYAENLFIALALMGYGIIGTNRRSHRRSLMLFAGLVLFAAAITVSGSRRTYLLMFPAVILLLLYRAFYIARYSDTERTAFARLCFGCGLCALGAAAVFLLQAGFERYSDIKYEQLVDSGGVVNEENSVDAVIDSISGGGMFEKRAVIWRVAADTALDYDFQDILVGRGSGYDSYLYDHTSDEALATLYKSVEQKPKNWMNPHNFVIADFLNGGLIGILLSLGLAASLFASLWAIFARRPGRALGSLTVAAFVYFGAFISGRYGFVNDKFFYIVLASIVAEHALAMRARPATGR